MPTDDPTGPDLAREALARARQDARQQDVPPPAPGRRRRAPRRRPDEPTLSGPGPDPRDPQPLGRAVRELVEEEGWAPTAAAAAVVGRWAEVVGADVAAHARPESLQGGVLVLVAESTAWATQLRLLAGAVRERVAAEVGPGVVREVRVKGPTTPDWRHGPRRVVGRGPRDTYG